MSATSTHELIDVQALQVGMLVHLEGGWMAHPFPLSRFKIDSAEQIATIRSLGLKHVRWEPRFSDVANPGGLPAGTHKVGTAAAGTSKATNAATSATNAAAPTTAGAPPPGSPSTPDTTNADARAQDPQRAARRAGLARQREALQRCERQFAEASSACAELTSWVQARPLDAGSQARALSQALLDKMLGEQELCIQLLGSAAGSKAAAHAVTVSILSLLLGRRLGLPDADMLDLGVGAMLHDVGKLDLPERVRHHEDHFVARELREYEEHVALGVAHARKMDLSAGASLVVAQHHEMCDGSGFPLRLREDRLTLPARIVALVNRYDNLCNANLAARSVTPHEALALMFASSANQFDTTLLGTFIKMMGVYPAGSTVQLSDDRFALVVSVNATRPLRPRVLVFDAQIPREESLVLDLQSQPDLGIRRSIKPTQLAAPVLNYLAPAKRVAYFFEPARELDAA